MVRRKVLAGFGVCALVFSASSTLLAADRVVARVVGVKTDNAEAYVQELAKGQALLKKLGSTAQIRIWRARFAGDHSGGIVVAVEYPNLAALAKDEMMTSTNAEYQDWLKGMGKLRTVVSDSIYEELKP